MTRRKRLVSRVRRVSGLALVGMMFFVAGCSASTSDPSGAQTSATARASPVATYPPPPVGMDAALEGTLRLVDQCLVVEGTDGAHTVPVFPSDEVDWSADVLTWRTKEYRAGDHILLGGGGGSSPDGYLPKGCVGLASWLVSA